MLLRFAPIVHHVVETPIHRPAPSLSLTYTHATKTINRKWQRLLEDIDTDVEAAASSLRLEARHAQRVRACACCCVCIGVHMAGDTLDSCRFGFGHVDGQEERMDRKDNTTLMLTPPLPSRKPHAPRSASSRRSAACTSASPSSSSSSSCSSSSGSLEDVRFVDSGAAETNG